MMAIHHTLQLLTTTYRDELAHIFIDCLNVLYLLNTQIKHATLHNSHPDKNILESITTMLQSHTQITTLHKVKAHANINYGNEQADTLAKIGCELDIETPQCHMNMHTLHHTTSKKTGGIQCKKHQTKALLDTLENTSSNMTKNII
jgi:ribonuclease HI